MAACAAIVTAAGLALTLPTSSPASAADPCTTPQLSDVMVSQGLPTYGVLARGKSTLVKLFLSTPACLPVGVSVAVTGATLTANTTATPIELDGSLPLPPLGSPSTAPVPASASDVQFLVPGSYIKPVSGPVNFSVTVRYQVTTPTAPALQDAVTFATMPGTTSPISASVAPAVLPAGVLVVPMGDAAKSADAQYPAAARSALQVGMTSLNRVLPVADSGGLVYNLNAGMLNLGAHNEPTSTGGTVAKNYMSTGTFCGSSEQMPYIAAQLEATRVAWNSISGNTRAQRALGEVWQGVSLGATTNTNSACTEGYAQVRGVSAWGRTVGTSLQGTSVTGAIAAMEYAHTVGAVNESDPRYDGSHHSKNVAADATAKGRAYNLYTQQWLQDNRTAMQYTPTGWNDTNTLYEKEDWDWLQCSVLPAVPANPVAGSSCRNPGELTYAAAGGAGQGTFVVTGSTDGTAAGTDAYSYTSTDNRQDPAQPSSGYRVVQRSASGIVRNDPIDVHFEIDEHDGPTADEHAVLRGSFGAAIPADSRATNVELWRGAPGAAGSTLLYSRPRDNAPQFIAAQAQGQSISVSANDERPNDLRLDLFVSCPGGSTSPLATGVKPTTVADKVAVFSQPYDASLACTNGQLSYRVSDGFLATTQGDLSTTSSVVTGSAAIYSPAAGVTPTAYQALSLSGSVRDALDKTVNDLRWSLSGPSFPVTPQLVTGATAKLVPPLGGYQPGNYTLTLRGFASNGSEIASTTRGFTVLADTDGDGIADRDELQTCYPANAVTDASNAVLDSDTDGLANVDDPAPCDFASTTGGQFNPTSFYKNSSGNNVRVQLVGAKIDLTTLRQSDIFITQIAGYATNNLTGSSTSLPATSWVVTGPTTATVTFDRTTLSNVLLSRPSMLGYIPFYVGTLDGRLKGADPSAPNVFP
jgi:hypothetical protein